VDEEGRRLDPEEGPAGEPEAAEEKTAAGIGAASTLPAGAASGAALHSLLERLDFASAGLAPDPSAFMDAPGLRPRISEEIASLIWHSLRMPVPDPAGGGPFRLADVAERRSEVEFLLRVSGKPGAVPESVKAGNGLLWGFIDLVFRARGRYYLLDWKSNRLDGYDAASIRASMEEHRYDLQWKLYAVALDRWLRSRLAGYDPAAHFGGVIYLYLRGALLQAQAAAPETSGGFSGFAHRPSPAELRDEYPRLLRETLGLA
jgi:exodeoxyribonuclease V beta subunit